MGYVDYLVKNVFKDIFEYTKEFYEHFDPALDIRRKGEEVFIDIEVPGFTEDQITCEIEGGSKFLGMYPHASLLRVRAEREDQLGRDKGKTDKQKIKDKYDVIVATRPTNVDKLILLPFKIEDKKIKDVEGSCTLVDGILTVHLKKVPATVKVIPIT